LRHVERHGLNDAGEAVCVQGLHVASCAESGLKIIASGPR
jgi:hypothetical protein